MDINMRRTLLLDNITLSSLISSFFPVNPLHPFLPGLLSSVAFMAKNKVKTPSTLGPSTTNNSHVKKRKGTENGLLSNVKKRKKTENEGNLSDFNSSIFPVKETHLKTMNRILDTRPKNPRTSSDMVEVQEGKTHRLDVDRCKKVHCRLVLKKSMIHKDGLTFSSEGKNLEKERREEEKEKTKPSRSESEVSAVGVKTSKDLTHISRQALSTEKTNSIGEPKQNILDTILAAQSRLFGSIDFQRKKDTEFQKIKNTDFKRKKDTEFQRKKETEFQKEKEREAARLKLQKTQRTVFIDNNMKSFEELEKLCGHSLSDFKRINPLKDFFGLVLKE